MFGHSVTPCSESGVFHCPPGTYGAGCGGGSQAWRPRGGMKARSHWRTACHGGLQQPQGWQEGEGPELTDGFSHTLSESCWTTATQTAQVTTVQEEKWHANAKQKAGYGPTEGKGELLSSDWHNSAQHVCVLPAYTTAPFPFILANRRWPEKSAHPIRLYRLFLILSFDFKAKNI